jgi:hypothetical protein
MELVIYDYIYDGSLAPLKCYEYDKIIPVFQVEIVWVTALCRFLIGNRQFGGPCKMIDNPEDLDLNLHRRENLKPLIPMLD